MVCRVLRDQPIYPTVAPPFLRDDCVRAVAAVSTDGRRLHSLSHMQVPLPFAARPAAIVKCTRIRPPLQGRRYALRKGHFVNCMHHVDSVSDPVLAR